MKAVAFNQPLPIDQPGALQDIELPAPVPGPRDLLVRVAALSVNPVDTKVRRNAQPAEGQFRVLGWDAVGTVEACGDAVEGFKAGDRVFYSGYITRPGTNSELHAVDERIAALAPKTLSDAEAAAQLFLSPKTIEYHLSNAYRKLGIRSRAELVRAVLAGSPAHA